MNRTLIDELRSIVGDRHVLDDPDMVAGAVVDWTGRFRGSTPAVVRPASTAEVADLVVWARAHHIALVPQGGNTSLVGGATPLAGEVVVSTRRLDAIGPVDADAGQLTAGAGATIAAVQAAASAVGWRYGVDFAARDTATVGGSIATNAGGIRVMRFGTTRRQLLGVEAVLGTGEVVSRLHGLVKDNTGLDLAALLCGSEGTLGIVTRARLALVPPADGVVTAVVGFDSVAAAVASTGVLRRRVATLEAVELVLGAGARLVSDQLGVPLPVEACAALLVVEAAGPPDPVDALAAGIAGLPDALVSAVATDSAGRETLWAVREHHTEAVSRLGVPLKFDVTLPAPALAGFVSETPDRVAVAAPGASTWVFGHLADGNMHVNVTGLDPSDPAVVAAVEEVVLGRVIHLGGSVSAEHGIGRAKVDWLARDRSSGDLSAMVRIKAALDPDGILNPGVLYPAQIL